MARRLLISIVLLAMVGLVSSCSGGPLAFTPLPTSGNTINTATVFTCLDDPGRIRVVVDSTATGNPSLIKVEIGDQAGGHERFDIYAEELHGPHFDGTSRIVHGPGCIQILLQGQCYNEDVVCSENWYPNSQTLRYAVTLVP